MRIPAFGILFQFAQLLFHLPRIGERAYVHASGGRTCGPEAVLMAQSGPQGPVTAHAEARDGAPLARGDRRVVRVDPVGKLLRDEGLELRRRIEGAVPIPAVLAVGAGDDHAVGVGQRTQVRDIALPGHVRTAVTVQQVEDGHAPPRTGVGNHDQRRNVALHLRAENRHGVDPCRRGGRRGEEEAKDQSVFSHSVRNILQKRARTTRTPDNKSLGVISSPVSQWSRASACRP